MSGTNKSEKGGGWNVSWKRFLIAASATANVALIVAVITMMSSHVLDGMFINEGLTRYCSPANDNKFDNSADRAQALRAYTCATGDAKSYFDAGFQSYLTAKGLK